MTTCFLVANLLFSQKIRPSTGLHVVYWTTLKMSRLFDMQCYRKAYSSLRFPRTLHVKSSGPSLCASGFYFLTTIPGISVGVSMLLLAYRYAVFNKGSEC